MTTIYNCIIQAFRLNKFLKSVFRLQHFEEIKYDHFFLSPPGRGQDAA